MVTGDPADAAVDKQSHRVGQQAMLDRVDPLGKRGRRVADVDGHGLWRIGGPPSTSSSAKWTVTPVKRTPQASASSIACIPGNAGSSDGCRLMTRSGKRLRNAPVRMLIQPARTTRSGLAAATTSASARSRAARSAVGSRAHHGRGDAGTLGSPDAERVGTRADHEHDLRVAAGDVDPVDQRLQVRARSRDQDRDAVTRRHDDALTRPTRPMTHASGTRAAIAWRAPAGATMHRPMPMLKVSHASSVPTRPSRGLPGSTG